MNPPRRWQKTDPGLREHPAFLDLVAELKSTPIMVDGLLHGLWAMAFRSAQDGNLTRFKPRAIARAVGWPGHGDILVTSLLEAGFLYHDEDGNLLIHDWYEWGGALFSQQREEVQRQRKHRKVTFHEPDVTVTERDITVTERDPRAKNKNKNKKDQESVLADELWELFWSLYPRKESKKPARSLWDNLNGDKSSAVAAVQHYATWATRNPDSPLMQPTTFLSRSNPRWEEWVVGPPAGRDRSPSRPARPLDDGSEAWS